MDTSNSDTYKETVMNRYDEECLKNTQMPIKVATDMIEVCSVRTALQHIPALLNEEEWPQRYAHVMWLLLHIDIPMMELIRASIAADIGFEHMEDIIDEYKRSLSVEEVVNFEQELTKFKDSLQ